MKHFATYHAVCECGAHVESYDCEKKCERCGRRLTFEWGGSLFNPASVQIEGREKNAVMVVGETRRADGCPDCAKARAHAYSDATTPGFFFTECEKHRTQPPKAKGASA